MESQPIRFNFGAIGTTWSIAITSGADDRSIAELRAAIDARIDEFDRAYSRFRSDSLVSEIARKPGEYRLPDDAVSMMDLYRELYDLTGGLVTPLIGQVLADAGYDAKYTLRPKAAIAPAKPWDDVMTYSVHTDEQTGRAVPMLVVKEPVLLDFGALGKGYLIDIVSDIIESRGVREYTVDAGGDIRHRSGESDGSDADGTVGTAKPLRIGMEDPEDSTKAVGVANLGDASICGSAGNRRVWDRFHHIIDPKSVESPRHILGLWTVARTTLLADAMSTALFFVSPDKLRSKYDFEYAILRAGREPDQSPGFPGGFFA